MVQKGYNSDINVRGQSFHVQTEDWGLANPYVVSRIFSNGAVLKTIKLSYDEVFKSGSSNPDEAIRLALKKQHTQVIDVLMSGEMP